MLSFFTLSTLFFAVSSFVAPGASAMPFHSQSRQCKQQTNVANSTATNTTSDACTQARLNILLSLIVSEDATSKINSTDPNTQAALTTANQGFSLVQTGIATIANAILANQTAPADARNQVGQGIDEVATALASINGTDAADPNLALAQKTINLAGTAANDVVANCK